MLSDVPEVSDEEPVRVRTMEGLLVELTKGTEKELLILSDVCNGVSDSTFSALTADSVKVASSANGRVEVGSI